MAVNEVRDFFCGLVKRDCGDGYAFEPYDESLPPGFGLLANVPVPASLVKEIREDCGKALKSPGSRKRIDIPSRTI